MLRWWMRWDVRRIIARLPAPERKEIRLATETELIGFHRGFGAGLRTRSEPVASVGYKATATVWSRAAEPR